MAVTIPDQLRSIDPWSESRFSDNYNLRSRLLTKGNDVVVFKDSFALSIADSTTLTVGPGIAIKDDAMIHITEAQSINLYGTGGGVATGYGVDADPPIHYSASDYYTYLVLNYRYARSMPSPSASYRCIEDMATYFTTDNHMYLGKLLIRNKKIILVSQLGVKISSTVYRRIVVQAENGFSSVNGGVVRTAPPEGAYVDIDVFEEWEHY